MKIVKTKIKDILLIYSKHHKDKRGIFREVFSEKILKKKFVFDCVSESKKNVLRGLHFQEKKPQGKFLSVIEGEIFDVSVDLRKKSKTFGKYFTIKLSSKSDCSIYIPPNFAHGFLCISNKCKIYYKCTEYRDKKSEKTIIWNDPDINIPWPKKKFILSKKDKYAKKFKDIIYKNSSIELSTTS